MDILAAELERMRADIEAIALPDTLYLVSVTQTPDGTGGFAESYGTATSGQPCRIDGMSKRTEALLMAASQRPMNAYVLSTPNDLVLSFADRLAIYGEQYKVVDVLDGSWSAVGRYVVERVQAGTATPPATSPFVGLDFSYVANSQYLALGV
jgi:hypothetical protein